MKQDQNMQDERWNDPFAEYRDGPGKPEANLPGKVLDYGNSDSYAPRAKARKSGLGGFFGLLALLGFLSVFFLGFGGAYFLPEGCEWVVITAFGTTFFFAGLAILAQAKQPFGLLFSGVGALVIAFSLAFGLWSEDLRDIIMAKAVPAALLSVFAIVGACLLVIPRKIARKRAEEHPVEIRARVKAKHERRWRDSDGHSHRGWFLVWGYYAGGKDRTYSSNTTRSPEPRQVGDEGVLYLSRTDPDDVWEPGTRSDTIVLTCIGAAFAAMGVLGLVLVLFVG